MDPNRQALAAELMRRQAGSIPSGAGISGGMGATRTPVSPTSQGGMSRMQPTGKGAAPSQSPYTQGAGQLKTAQPGEAMMILKTMATRLKQLPPGA